MSSFDDFVYIPMHPHPGHSQVPNRPGTGDSRNHHHLKHPHIGGPGTSNPGGSSVAREFYEDSKGKRAFTEGVIVDAIRKTFPNHHLSVCNAFMCDFLAFADARDDVTYSPHGDPKDLLVERMFLLPARRYGDENGGSFVDRVVYGCYDYVYQGNSFLLYAVEGQDGMYKSRSYYLLEEEAKSECEEAASKKSDDLIVAATKWLQELHGEVLVFDQGYWQKSTELYDNIQKAKWEDVILEKERKASIIEDIIGFFNAESRYSEFGVPWKRGVIFYGPPGNGKTISTKALMNDVSKKISPKIESLYVKTFNSYAGPEYGIRQIFQKARQMAPCLLIFEDIDSLILPNVRSYFLNEVDGLESNHGILMIGSTNHLERLDPGIAKRPSRFDRKYLFDVPSRDERVQYAEYWRHKLASNKKVEFPEEMSARIADITEKFSFAYMKEAFVAALLSIVRSSDEKPKYRSLEDGLSGNILWKELQKQITNLRREMDGEDDDDAIAIQGKTVRSEIVPTRQIFNHPPHTYGLSDGFGQVLDFNRQPQYDPSTTRRYM